MAAFFFYLSPPLFGLGCWVHGIFLHFCQHERIDTLKIYIIISVSYRILEHTCIVSGSTASYLISLSDFWALLCLKPSPVPFQICAFALFSLSATRNLLFKEPVKLIWHRLKVMRALRWLRETSHPFRWPMPTSERRTRSRHCHFPNKEWLSPGFSHLFMGTSIPNPLCPTTFAYHSATPTVITIPRPCPRDRSGAARLSACRIDGSYELLAGEESNIAGIHDWRPAAEITNDCGALV